MKNLYRPTRLLALLSTVLALTGCAALPDVTPFASGTRQLAAAVRASGDAAVTIVAQEHSTAKAGQLRDAWDARDKAMNAMVRYSDSLVAIAQGFSDAKANAANLGTSVEQLCMAAGLLVPGGGAAPGIAIEIGTLITTQIAKAKAARSLAEALLEAQPVVDAVAAQLGRRLVQARAGKQPSNDITDLVTIFDGVTSTIQTQRVAATQPTTDFLTVLAGRLAALQPAINAGTPAAVTEAMQLTAAAADAESTRASLDTPFIERLEHIQRARTLAESLAAAVDAWATAHADLAFAMAQRRPVSIESLTDSALEIRALVKRMQEP